ncbi:MAG: hypothetical protein Q9205_006402, partial [Flavoplaca limonia]
MPSEDKTSASEISAPMSIGNDRSAAVTELEKPMVALSVDAKDFLSKATPMNKDSTKEKSPEQTSDQEQVNEGAKKSMVQVVNEMLKETKVGQAKDLHSLVMLNLKDTRDEGDPEWYSSRAMFWTAHPWRLARAEWAKQLMEDHKDWICNDWKDGQFRVLDYACGNGIASHALLPHVSNIVGIDNDQRTVNMYNEVVKRQEYPDNLEVPMHAYYGDLMPDFPSRKAPKLTDQALVEALDHGGFDLVVVMLAMDCFEILPLSAHDRVKQILYNLDALVKRLRDGGTLLILDFQKATTQTKIGLNGLKEGHKPNGYHSDTLVDALKHLSMDVDVIDGLRFQW